MAEHAHPHAHLLFKLGGGDRRMLVEGAMADVTNAQCLLINPWQKHADLAEQPGGPTLMLVLYIEPIWMADSLGLGAVGFGTLAAQTSAPMRALAERIGAALAGRRTKPPTMNSRR